MECQTCQCVNDASSRFCKECGSKLTAAATSPATEEHTAPKAPEAIPVSPEIAEKRKARAAELLPRAFAFSEKGALAEAIATAEEAAGLVPSSVAAHALLANLYEKSGQMARAIESMKKVVALTPDATDEKEHLAELQREATRRASAPPIEDEEKPLSPLAYWVPRVGAALAGVLVVGVGLLVLMRPAEPLPRKNSGRGPVMAVGNGNPGAAFVSMPQVPAPTIPRAIFMPAPVGSDVDPFSSKGFAPTPRPRQRDISPSSPLRQLPRHSSTPRPEPDQEPRPTLVPPVSVSVPAYPTGSESQGGIQARPPSENISAGPPAGKQAKPEPEGEGFIRIETHPASSGGGSDKATAPSEKTEGGDPAQQARVLQGAGRYRDAVGRYQVALAASEAPGELHQNLGLCYQRLGDVGAARDSYSRAIDAYQAQLRRGREAEGARRGIASCQAALEILRG